jgi:hypothetical protein
MTNIIVSFIFNTALRNIQILLCWWMFWLWLFLGRTGVFIWKHLPLNYRFQRMRFMSFFILYVTEVTIVALSLNLCICYISDVLYAIALEYLNQTHIISELVFVTTDGSTMRMLVLRPYRCLKMNGKKLAIKFSRRFKFVWCIWNWNLFLIYHSLCGETLIHVWSTARKIILL